MFRAFPDMLCCTSAHIPSLPRLSGTKPYETRFLKNTALYNRMKRLYGINVQPRGSLNPKPLNPKPCAVNDHRKSRKN